LSKREIPELREIFIDQESSWLPKQLEKFQFSWEIKNFSVNPWPVPDAQENVSFRPNVIVVMYQDFQFFYCVIFFAAYGRPLNPCAGR
jgi:hypothetical protein